MPTYRQYLTLLNSKMKKQLATLAASIGLLSFSPFDCPTTACKWTSFFEIGSSTLPEDIVVVTNATPKDGLCLGVINPETGLECKPFSCWLYLEWTIEDLDGPQDVTMIATSDLPSGQTQRARTALGYDPNTGEYTGNNWFAKSLAPCGETTEISISIDIESEPQPLAVNSYSLSCAGGCEL